MSRKLFYLRVTGFTYSRIVFWAMYISRIYTKLLNELEKFNLYQSLNTTPYVGKLTLVQYVLLILSFAIFQEQSLAKRFCKLAGNVTF